MSIKYNFRNMTGSGCGASACLDKFGCPKDRCPDFVIRRHDTKPAFKVMLEDCDGPLDIQGLVVEVNMWAKGKLKKTIHEECEYFALADNIGYNQIMVGDIIIMDRVRSPEYMLVIGFDECNNLIRVQRGYRNTTPSKWKKGSVLRIFRVLNSPAQTEMIYEDIENPDGTTDKDTLTEAYFVYEWSPEDTCLPGCYWLEFKLLKMKDLVLYLPGGYWTGKVHQLENGSYYTGTIHTDASVVLSYDSVEDRYYLPSDHWTGIVHIESDTYYTGSIHNDGSVILDKTDKPSDVDVAYSVSTTEIGTELIISDDSWSFPSTLIPECPSVISDSCVISFSDPNLQPVDFGCTMGEGVEWVRRFPQNGEGFLIKIENSFTTEW